MRLPNLKQLLESRFFLSVSSLTGVAMDATLDFIVVS